MDWFDVLQSVLSGLVIGLVVYLLDERRARRDRKLSDFRIASNWAVSEPKTSLRGFDLSNSNLSGNKFVGANLEEVTFRDSKMWATNFAETNLRRADFRNTEIVGSKFTRSVAILGNFSRATIKNRKDPDYEYVSDFTGAVLVYSNFRNARLEGSVLKNTDLKGADFTGASVVNCDFSGSTITESKWKRVRRVENCVWQGVKVEDQANFPEYLWKEIQAQNVKPVRKVRKPK